MHFLLVAQEAKGGTGKDRREEMSFRAYLDGVDRFGDEDLILQGREVGDAKGAGVVGVEFGHQGGYLQGRGRGSRFGL